MVWEIKAIPHRRHSVWGWMWVPAKIILEEYGNLRNTNKVMNTVPPMCFRVRPLSAISLALLLGISSANAELTFSKEELLRRGNAVSEKVSNFFGRVFNRDRYQQPPQQQGYAPRYQHAPRQQGATSPQQSVSQPVYRQAPVSPDSAPAKARANTASSSLAKKSLHTDSSVTADKKQAVAQRPAPKKEVAKPTSSERPVFTSAKTRKLPPLEDTTPVKKPAQENESVVYAPQTPGRLASETPSTTPASPKNTSVQESVNAPSSSTALNKPASSKNAEAPAQEFPTATASGKPGRVISPYAPHNELDVQGLPSGSLALDPTTQKVFKLP